MRQLIIVGRMNEHGWFVCDSCNGLVIHHTRQDFRDGKCLIALPEIRA